MPAQGPHAARVPNPAARRIPFHLTLLQLPLVSCSVLGYQERVRKGFRRAAEIHTPAACAPDATLTRRVVLTILIAGNA